jgi:transcriptional regulator with XRE-family HTH domain
MLPHRLKEARLKAGLSQQRLGILAGIDEATASARMNQYERGIHTPDFALACRLAEVLNIPACYFYTVEDDLAGVIARWSEENIKL